MKSLCNLLYLVFTLAIGTLPGCGGGSNRQLQSLSVSPASTTAQGGQAQFTATGQFTAAPMSVSPASVAWFQSPPVFDPPSSIIGITPTNQPFMAQCFGFPSGTTITISAIAPMDGKASSVPLSVFLDLVREHTATQESAFVAATA